MYGKTYFFLIKKITLYTKVIVENNSTMIIILIVLKE